MRALVYEGPFKVAVKQVEDPKIQHPNDAIDSTRRLLLQMGQPLSTGTGTATSER